MYGCHVLHDFTFDFPADFAESSRRYTVRFRRTSTRSLLLPQKESLIFSRYQGRDFTLTLGKTLLPPFSRLRRIDIRGVGSFQWFGEEEEIRYRLTNGVEDRHRLFWIVRIVLPLYGLIEKDLLLLHAASFRIDRHRAVGIIAPSNTGKSRWIETLDRLGFSILGDDILALERDAKGWKALPSYPMLRLDRSRESLGKSLRHFQKSPLELCACFRLEYNISLTDREFRRLSGIEKVNALERAREFHLPLRLEEIGSRHLSRWFEWAGEIPVWSFSTGQRPRDIAEAVVKMDELIAENERKG